MKFKTTVLTAIALAFLAVAMPAAQAPVSSALASGTLANMTSTATRAQQLWARYAYHDWVVARAIRRGEPIPKYSQRNSNINAWRAMQAAFAAEAAGNPLPPILNEKGEVLEVRTVWNNYPIPPMPASLPAAKPVPGAIHSGALGGSAPVAPVAAPAPAPAAVVGEDTSVPSAEPDTGVPSANPDETAPAPVTAAAASASGDDPSAAPSANPDTDAPSSNPDTNAGGGNEGSATP